MAVRTIVLSRHGSNLASPVIIHDIIHILMCIPSTPNCGFSGVSPDGNCAYVHSGSLTSNSKPVRRAILSLSPHDTAPSITVTTWHCTVYHIALHRLSLSPLDTAPSITVTTSHCTVYHCHHMTLHRLSHSTAPSITVPTSHYTVYHCHHMTLHCLSLSPHDTALSITVTTSHCTVYHCHHMNLHRI